MGNQLIKPPFPGEINIFPANPQLCATKARERCPGCPIRGPWHRLSPAVGSRHSESPVPAVEVWHRWSHGHGKSLKYNGIYVYTYMYTYIYIYTHTHHYIILPVVPHKAAAEVSKIGNYRRGALLWNMDGRANPLVDQKMGDAPSLSLFLCLSLCLSINKYIYIYICLSVYLSICLSVCLSTYLSFYLSVYHSIYQSIYQSTFFSLSRSLSLSLSVYLSMGKLENEAIRRGVLEIWQ